MTSGTRPSMAATDMYDDGPEPQVRLTYSNAALLEKLDIHVVEQDPPATGGPSSEAATPLPASNPFGTFRLTDEGAFLSNTNRRRRAAAAGLLVAC